MSNPPVDVPPSPLSSFLPPHYPKFWNRWWWWWWRDDTPLSPDATHATRLVFFNWPNSLSLSRRPRRRPSTTSQRLNMATPPATARAVISDSIVKKCKDRRLSFLQRSPNEGNRIKKEMKKYEKKRRCRRNGLA